mgnify:CR=1 FL=1
MSRRCLRRVQESEWHDPRVTADGQGERARRTFEDDVGVQAGLSLLLLARRDRQRGRGLVRAYEKVTLRTEAVVRRHGAQAVVAVERVQAGTADEVEAQLWGLGSLVVGLLEDCGRSASARAAR